MYWVSEVTDRKRLPNGRQKIAECSNSNFSTIRTSKLIMPSKPKGSRREYSVKTILAILELKTSGQTYFKIAHHFKIPKSSVTVTIHTPGLMCFFLSRPIVECVPALRVLR